MEFQFEDWKNNWIFFSLNSKFFFKWDWKEVAANDITTVRKYSRQQGTSCMQMSVSDSPGRTHLSEAVPTRSNLNEAASQRASRQRALPVVSGVLFQLDRVRLLTEFWQSVSLSLFLPLFPPSPRCCSPSSLSTVPPLWTTARVHLGFALLWHRKIANPGRHTLIEHWKREFHKEADLLFITSRLLLLFLTLSFYFSAHTALLFSSWTFSPLKFSRPAVPPSPLGVSHGAAFFPSCQYYVGDSNVMANTVITSWFTRGSALPGSIICSRSRIARGRPRALQEIGPQYNIANLRNDREAITQKLRRSGCSQRTSEDRL